MATTSATELVGADDLRVAALRSYRVLDTEPEAAFDDLSRLAAQLCSAPMALVTLVDADRLWFKSRLGLDLCESSREQSFCTHALNQRDVFVVPNALDDPRFADYPSVTGAPHIRFYAGAPLVTADGHVLGTLCVLDTIARTLSTLQIEQLTTLARQVVGQLVLRRQAEDLAAEMRARQTAQAALERAQHLLSGVLSSTDALVYAKDLDGRFLLANPALHELARQRDGTICGRSDHDLFPALAAAEFHRNDNDVVASNSRRVFTEMLPHSDGTVHRYLSTKFPLHDHTGQVYAVAGVSTDVTELEEQRRRRAESEQRWQALVECSPVAVAVIGADGTFSYANPPAVRLYSGSDVGSLVGLAAREFVPDGGQDATVELFASALAGRTVLGHRWKLRQTGGRIIDVEINAVRVEYDGNPAVQVELRDVTEQVVSSRALIESESRWRAVFAGSPVGIGLSDERGLFVSANAALCTLLGRTEADVIGHSSAEFTHPGDLESHRNASTLIAAADDGVVRIEKRYLRPDGEIRWAWLTVAHTPGPTGQVWTLAHVQDITDRKATEQAVADSEANLTAVARVVKQIQSGTDARQTVVDSGIDLAQAAWASLVEPTPDGLALKVTASTHPELVGSETPLTTTSATAHVFMTGKPMFMADPASNPLVTPGLLKLTNAASIYAVPVAFADAVNAVLLVAWKHRVPDLDDKRVRVVKLLADNAGVALRQAALLSELESLALTDPLTMLPNRRSWDKELARLLITAQRRAQPLTVALADLDRFKKFNDSYGHSAGDVLLREFAQRGQLSIRADDVMARWGGEEFAFALPDCPTEEARAVLERVRLAMPQGETCSIGYATWDGVESADSLLARADGALYSAKNNGRNLVRGG